MLNYRHHLQLCSESKAIHTAIISINTSILFRTRPSVSVHHPALPLLLSKGALMSSLQCSAYGERYLQEGGVKWVAGKPEQRHSSKSKEGKKLEKKGGISKR